MADLLERMKTRFVLWRPGHTNPVPKLVIGNFVPGNPPTLANLHEVDFVQSTQFPELWEIPCAAAGLIDGHVYHYWFRLKDSNPEGAGSVMDVTDPFAMCVDWRLMRGEDPAGVVLFRNGQLIPCDPDGQVAPVLADGMLDALPPNNRMVIYELPTRWTLTADENNVEVSAGTFRDVRALVEAGDAGANFEGVGALGRGRAHLLELGVNALELLPPADSFVGREWGYATSNYLAPDYDLGFPAGHASPTAIKDLVALVESCSQNGIRFIPDVVMAFATRASMENVSFMDFHVRRGHGDPEEDGREDFGGRLMKYNFRVNGYDPVSGTKQDIVPARQWMKVFLTRWMQFFRAAGVRMDSVVNFNNWDFIQEFRDLARQLWMQRWKAQHGGSANGADERMLVIGEELAVPLGLVQQNRLDALWNEKFKPLLRDLIPGAPSLSPGDFEDRVRKMVDCRGLGFTDGSQAVNYITSHDVEGFRNERFYNYLDNNGIAFKEKYVKLAFACLLTAVGVPMILAGEEFADEHDLKVVHPFKQTDPVNFNRLEHDWRRRIFDSAARLVRLRTQSPALAVNDTRFLHFDLTGGRRVVAWERGVPGSTDKVVVVANFSHFETENPFSPGAEYVVPNWPSLPAGRRWREITMGRDVPANQAGREPLFPWEAKVYATVV